MRQELEPLFTPFTCGSLTTANRFVMSPMTRNFSPDGVPVPGAADYYARRAHMGLVITEGVGPDHPGALGDGTTGGPALPVLYGDAALASWKSIVDAVHAAGGKIAPQLWHMGPIRLAGTGPHPGAPSISPSGIWGPLDKTMVPPDYLEAVKVPGIPASDAEIADIIAGFARSAAQAHELGFDAIALHGAHGYLLDSFLWGETNQRSDQWGGDRLRRTRLARDVIRAVRRAIPADKPIIFRFSQWKLQDYGARLAETPEELSMITSALADAGVDIFDVSTRNFDAPAFDGSDMGLSGWVRKLTGKPVMTVGGIGFDKDLQSSFMEPTAPIDNLGEVARRFGAGEFDLVAIGRAALMDADWIGKVRREEAFKPFDMSAYGRLD
ncbi:12-oxophytodienoate reductase [Novosphingobium sp.]|jgi:2,4-dienoyl-CoA reductase-like NADH-dependent reductase (Old Yellow Enzyme family)|uniref:oxidoreductase n=1 Tax=Novosphingobium sp. TaxID=1874826 RepID=UPI00286DE592|nr:12-oxophytodienoate reductase [Novosphingobium sp.]